MLTSTDSAGALTTEHIFQVVFSALSKLPATPGIEEFPVHAIPQGNEPRWLILGDPQKALPVLRSWRPWNLGSRFRWDAVLFAAYINLLPLLPGMTSGRAFIDASYWRRSLPEFPEKWNAVVHVGNRSHTRKAIVFFLGGDQRVRYVAKVPLVPGAAQAISNEAAILLRMKAFEYLPRVLFQDAVRGVAAQSWLDGKPVSRGFTAAHVDLLSSLVNPGSTVVVSDRRAEIVAQLDELDLPFDRSLLARAVELLSFDQPLQGFVEHRDFAPWNLKWLRDGRLGLLDWEWSLADSLPWQDICRFFYLEDALFNGSGKVWEAMTGNPLLLSYLRRFAILPEALPALTMHYLLRILCMDWQSGNVRLAQYTFRQIQSLLDTCRNEVAMS